MNARIPQALSEGEEMFALHMKVNGLKPEREYEFAPGRKYRADFAFPNRKLLIEIEGGTTGLGRHNRAAGYADDCRKYNLAAALGFTVLRYTTEMVRSGEAERQVTQLVRAV